MEQETGLFVSVGEPTLGPPILQLRIQPPDTPVLGAPASTPSVPGWWRRRWIRAQTLTRAWWTRLLEVIGVR